MSKAGPFEIRVWKGGHPIWCELTIHSPGPFNALELRDLEYAVQKARIEAREEARRMDPKRVEDY